MQTFRSSLTGAETPNRDLDTVPMITAGNPAFSYCIQRWFGEATPKAIRSYAGHRFTATTGSLQSILACLLTLLLRCFLICVRCYCILIIPSISSWMKLNKSCTLRANEALAKTAELYRPVLRHGTRAMARIGEPLPPAILSGIAIKKQTGGSCSSRLRHSIK